MNKRIMNLMIGLQRRQSRLFWIMLLGNEVYIRLYFGLRKPRILLNNYSCRFSVNGKDFTIRTLVINEVNEIYNFFHSSITTDSVDFFLPHKTDLETLKAIFKKTSHIPLGIFHGNILIGYALIRLLFPKKGSYAIFIADKWQGKRIGTAALGEQINLIKRLDFEPYSAVNKKNQKSLRMLKKLGIEFDNDLGKYLVVKDTRGK